MLVRTMEVVMTTLRDVDQVHREKVREKFLDLDILEACNPDFIEKALNWDKSWTKSYRRLWKAIRSNLNKIKDHRKTGEIIAEFEKKELLLNEVVGRNGSNTRTVFVALLSKFDVLADFGDRTAQPLSQKAKDLLEELKKIDGK